MSVRLGFLIVALLSMAAPCHAGALGSHRSSPDNLRNHSVYLPLVVKTDRAFYVSPTGNDAWPGSFTQPFKTINKGAGSLEPGDTLYVRGGIYQETVAIENSGTPATPIRILAYSGETPIVDGDNYSLPVDDYGVLFDVRGSHVQIVGFEVRYSNGMGVVLSGQYDSASQMNVHHVREQGMLAKGDYGIIEESQVWLTANRNVPGGPYRDGGWACALCAARDSMDGLTAGAILRGNVSHDNYGEGLSTFQATGTILEGNIVYDNMMNIYVSDAQNVLVQGNLAYYTAGNSIPGSYVGIMLGDEKHTPPSQNITVVNNLAYGNRQNFYWWSGGFGEGMVNVLVAHNTFVDAAGDPTHANLQIDSGPHQDVRVMNNIIVQDDAVPIALVPRGLSFSNNLWSKAPRSAANGAGDVIGDPLLAKGETIGPEWFVPMPTSPAIDCARVLGEVADDYLGKPRGALPDIGAYEVQDHVASTCSSGQNLKPVSLTGVIDFFVRVVATLSR